MTTTLKTATPVRCLDGFRGDARLYKCDPPMPCRFWDEELTEKHGGVAEYVIVSAVIALTGPETYIFPANEAGEITDWGELDGSFKGGLDHERALNRAGYEVTP